MSANFGCVGNTIKTRSGNYIDLLDPKEEQINFSDIAGALSKICRFNGQSSQFYSVSEHLCHCVFQALLDGRSQAVCVAVYAHDFSESFLGDMTKPLKLLLPDYQNIEKNMEEVIGRKFGIDIHEHEAAVKEIDHAMLIAERKVLMSHDDVKWHGERQAREINPDIKGWTPEEAEVIFTSYARFLGIVDSNLEPMKASA